MHRFILIAISFLLVGCQTSVKSNVTKFHSFDDLAPKSFKVVSSMGQSLEAATYADLIASKLEGYGWKRSNASEMEVSFNLSIDNGRVETGSVPIFGKTGGGTVYNSGTVYGSGSMATYSGTSYKPATFGVVGAAPFSVSVYTRVLALNIKSLRTGKRIFEGTVRSEGTTATMAPIAPCLIASLFKSFPGESGKSETVQLNSDACEM